MRWLPVALILLAGCTTPVDEGDHLFGVCPQWIESGVEGLDAAATYQDYPLDQFRLEMTTTGEAEVRANVDGVRASMRVFEDNQEIIRPFLSLSDQSMEAIVYLSAVDEGAASGGNLTLDITGEVEVKAYPAYRVCGV